MSLDNVFDVVYNIKDFFKKRKSSRFYIEKKFFKNDKTSVLKIIISPRGDSVPPTDKILFRRLCKKGYSCLYYCISGSVLSPDVNETIRYFNLVKDQIRSDISELKTKHNFKKVDIISSSLGAVSVCLVANNNDYVDNIFLIVPGSCLASSLWNGIRTQNLRKIYENQKINQEELKNIWATLAPKNNINELRNKNIFISISKSDKVIPYVFGKEFASLVKDLYPNNTIIKENNFLGHFVTVIKYYFFSKELLK